jgi:hypothetical protein
MKTVKDKDLVIGEKYWDISANDRDATIFEYIGVTEGEVTMKYIKGRGRYEASEDGLYRFGKPCTDVWYQF